MSKEFAAVNWEVLFAGKDMDETLEAFMCIYNELCDKHITHISIDRTKHYRRKWMNAEIIKLVAEKNRLFFACRASGNRSRKVVTAAYNKH